MEQLKYTADIELNEEQITAILAKALEVEEGDVTIRKRYDERTKTVQLIAIIKKTFEIPLIFCRPDKGTAQPVRLCATLTSSDALDNPNIPFRVERGCL